MNTTSYGFLRCLSLRDGKVRIWHDRNAVDTPAAQARYGSHFYRVNQKLSGVGYNLFLLGGI